jgi:hypothetical protein
LGEEDLAEDFHIGTDLIGGIRTGLTGQGGPGHGIDDANEKEDRQHSSDHFRIEES